MPKIKTLRNKANRLYQELGRKMYSYCFCGKPYSCLHHHIPKSRSSALRYEIKNGIPICAGCHLQHHSANDPEISFKYIKYMKRLYGDNWEEDLRKQRFANKDLKTNIKWYQDNIEMLEEKIKNYKEKPKIIKDDNF